VSRPRDHRCDAAQLALRLGRTGQGGGLPGALCSAGARARQQGRASGLFAPGPGHLAAAGRLRSECGKSPRYPDRIGADGLSFSCAATPSSSDAVGGVVLRTDGTPRSANEYIVPVKSDHIRSLRPWVPIRRVSKTFPAVHDGRSIDFGDSLQDARSQFIPGVHADLAQEGVCHLAKERLHQPPAPSRSPPAPSTPR